MFDVQCSLFDVPCWSMFVVRLEIPVNPQTGLSALRGRGHSARVTRCAQGTAAQAILIQNHPFNWYKHCFAVNPMLESQR